MNKDGAIGYNGGMPWDWISEDMRNFHRITCSGASTRRNVVVMGRLTFESLPSESRPLRRRINVVVTRNAEEKCDNFTDGSRLQDVYFVSSYQQAIELCEHLKDNNWANQVFGIGGASCYEALLPHTNHIYLTHVPGTHQHDVVFPEHETIEEQFQDVTTPLEVSVDGDVIVITPVRDLERAEKFREGLVEINRCNASVFRRLAE